jgi:hypothetical protein
MYFNTNSNNSKNLFAQSKGERNSTSRRISEEQLRGISSYVLLRKISEVDAA